MAIKPIEILINAKDNASSVFSSLQGKVAAVGAAIATYFGISAFSNIVKGAADLEQGMSRVQAATGATAEEMAKLRKAAEDAGANSKFTSTEAAAALEGLAKAGLSANDAIATLPAVMQLAQAGDIDLATSSEFVTKAVMGMGLAFSDAGRVADVLALGANATNTSVTGLSQALSYAAPVASSLGVSLESTVAIIGKFADAGIDASRAGTALNSILSQFANPASKFREELASAGITTGNFEDALHQLAAAGPAGSKAINAVGQEAGPALRALLNQGMGALDELTGKLKNAEGSAAAAAKAMSDNLNGSLQGLSSAWGTLKNALGTPVLPVLKDGVDQLAGALKSVVADGTIGRFGEAIATAFQNGIKWVREFVGQVDFTQLAADMRAFADRTGEVFNQVGEYATNAGNAVKLAYGVMSGGANAVMTAIYGIAASYTEAAVRIVDFAAKASDALAKISIGSAKKELQQQAEDMRGVLGGLSAVRDEFIKKTMDSLDATAQSAQTARNGFAGLVAPIASATQATTEWQKTVAAANVEIDKGAASAAAAGVAYQKKVQSEERAAEAAAAHAEKIRLLQEAYDGFIRAGNLNEAIITFDELTKAQREAAASSEELRKKQEETAAAIAAAYKDLGITTDAELKSVADRAKGNFDRLVASGTASARELALGFKDTAEKIIAANDGVATSWVEANAATRGYKVEVDAAGKATIVAMDGAKGAVKGVEKSVIDVSAALKQMGIDASTASQQVKDLAAAGQMLAAAEQARRDAYNKDLEASKFMNRGSMKSVDDVPSFESKEQADAWLVEWEKQYAKNNPFTTKTDGFGRQTTLAEWRAEVDAIALRNTMKGNGNATTSAQTPLESMRSGQTITINLQQNGQSYGQLNTDSAGAATLQAFINSLAQAKGVAQ